MSRDFLEPIVPSIEVPRTFTRAVIQGEGVLGLAAKDETIKQFGLTPGEFPARDANATFAIASWKRAFGGRLVEFSLTDKRPVEAGLLLCASAETDDDKRWTDVQMFVANDAFPTRGLARILEGRVSTKRVESFLRGEQASSARYRFDAIGKVTNAKGYARAISTLRLPIPR